MPLTQMTPGGKWVRPPFEAPPTYVPPKQLEAHLKRLISDGWMPIEDPRREEMPEQQPKPVDTREVALQARIDQLEAMVRQLVAQKEQTYDDQKHDGSADSESPVDDRRSRRGKSSV